MQLLVERLRLLLGRLELFVRALQFLVRGLRLFVRSCQLFVRRQNFLDAALQVVPRILKLLLQMLFVLGPGFLLGRLSVARALSRAAIRRLERDEEHPRREARLVEPRHLQIQRQLVAIDLDANASLRDPAVRLDRLA